MGNPDLLIAFNDGLVSFLIDGRTYSDEIHAINIGIEKWSEWLKDLKDHADYPEEINYGIKKINIFAL